MSRNAATTQRKPETKKDLGLPRTDFDYRCVVASSRETALKGF